MAPKDQVQFKVLHAVEETPHISERQLAEMLGVSTINRAPSCATWKISTSLMPVIAGKNCASCARPSITNTKKIPPPVLHVVPLQLFSYHAVLVKGAGVDKPRNLAKSVTVE